MIVERWPGWGGNDRPRPGDFQIIVFEASGSTRVSASPTHWHLVGTTIDHGEIRLVYVRTGHK